MARLLQNLVIVARTSRRDIGSFAFAVLAVALGAAATASAFSFIDAVRFRALPYRDAATLVAVGQRPPSGNCVFGCLTSYTSFDAWRLGVRSLGTLSAHTGTFGELDDESGQTISGRAVSGSLLPTLGIQPVLGRLLDAEDDQPGAPPVALIGHELWMSAFGGRRDVVSQQLRFVDVSYTVVGVMPHGFRFDRGAQYWIPLEAFFRINEDRAPLVDFRQAQILSVLGRAPDVGSLERGRQELALAVRTAPNLASDSVGDVRDLRSQYERRIGSLDLVLGLVALAMLLLSCANLAGVLLVRGSTREREVAVRLALGAPFSRIARTMVAESVLISVVGTLIGSVAATFVVGWIEHGVASSQMLGGSLPAGMDLRIDIRVVAVVMALSIVTSLIANLAPIRHLRRIEIRDALLAGGRTASGGKRLSRNQGLFVVFQVGCAVVLLGVGGLLGQTLLTLQRFDVGFAYQRIIEGGVSLPPSTPDSTFSLINRIGIDITEAVQSSGVALESNAEDSQMRSGIETVLIIGDSAGRTGRVDASLAVNPEYFEILGVRIAGGRSFLQSDDRSAPAVAIVSESAARAWWPGRSPIGRALKLGGVEGEGPVLTIVGVAADNKASGQLLDEYQAIVYTSLGQFPGKSIKFYTRTTGNIDKAIVDVRRTLRDLLPGKFLWTQSVNRRLASSISGVRTYATAVSGLALAGLILAGIGIYGSVSFATASRRKEISIRLALGATPRDVLLMIVKQGLQFAFAGLAWGLVGSFLLAMAIRSTLYGTSPASLPVLATVSCFTILTVLLAIAVPARKAMRVGVASALTDS